MLAIVSWPWLLIEAETPLTALSCWTTLFKRGVVPQPGQIDVDRAGLRLPGGGVVDLDVERTVDGRVGQSGGIERRVGIGDARPGW